MRSDLVFRAREKISNVYLLCRRASKMTRTLHFASTDTSGAIEDALVTIANAPCLVHEGIRAIEDSANLRAELFIQ